jgi:hypothetical protein
MSFFLSVCPEGRTDPSVLPVKAVRAVWRYEMLVQFRNAGNTLAIRMKTLCVEEKSEIGNTGNRKLMKETKSQNQQALTAVWRYEMLV